MNALCVYAFVWRIVFNFTSSSSLFILTCTTGTMRMTSLQPTVFQTCLWRLIWMRVPPETRPPLWGLRPHRCVQSTAVPQKLEQVKKKKNCTLPSHLCLLYVRIHVETQTFSGFSFGFSSPLSELSSGLLTFAQFGHKDNVDAKVCTVLLLYCINHSI